MRTRYLDTNRTNVAPTRRGPVVGKGRVTRRCDGCGQAFEAVYPKQRHCRMSCQQLAAERERRREPGLW